jgi:RND family efflux transporter MFP subunit
VKPVCCVGIAFAALTLALGACSSGGDRAEASVATASQWLAVARGKVDVEGGMVQIAARGDGIVDAVAVEQGDVVKAGQTLARLDPRAAKIAVAAAQAGVEQARAQLAELDVRWRQAKQHASRIVAAAKAGAATGEAAEQTRAAVASLAARREGAQAALEAAQQKLAATKLQLDATTLRAPVAGTVVTRNIAIGQAVSAMNGMPLFELLPDRPHIVRAQVDADVAASIHPGMHADVVRDSGTGPVYHATVSWVGQVLQSATLTQDPLQRALADDVDCTLRLEPGNDTAQLPLKIGQRVLVRFPRDHP